MLESYWLQICPYYDPRVVIYDRKMFIRLATAWANAILNVGPLIHGTRCFANDVCKLSRKMPFLTDCINHDLVSTWMEWNRSSVTMWLVKFLFWPFPTLKIYPIAFCQMLNLPSKIAQGFYLYARSGDISPNLITLNISSQFSLSWVSNKSKHLLLLFYSI